MINQPSQKINQFHIPHAIFGSDYNFRQVHGEEKYQSNLKRALEAMSIAPKQLFHGNQVHSNHVAIVGASTEYQACFAGHPLIDQTDGFITNCPETALLVRMADCTPILLYDPVNHVLAAIHSGWRSTVKRISAQAIEKMKQNFGTQAEDVLAYVGPCIDLENYQVGPEVYQAFNDFASRETFFKPDGDKFLLSMAQANIQVLVDAGVSINNIDLSPLSTYLSDQLHSARQEGADYQLNALIAYLP